MTELYTAHLFIEPKIDRTYLFARKKTNGNSCKIILDNKIILSRLSISFVRVFYRR